MARRFATSFMRSCYSSSLGRSPWVDSPSAIVSTAAGSLHYIDTPGWLLIAPSCYSEVRKVVFWCVFRHEYTGSEVNVPVRLRVAPSSTSNTDRLITAANIPEGAIYNVTAGGSPLFKPADHDTEDCFYGAQSANQNQINTVRFNTVNGQGSQLVFQEFNRFEAGSQDFFDDWDNIAAAGNDDAHIGYSVAVERLDGNSWVDNANDSTIKPTIIACGFAIVQAPSPNNNTRIYLPSSYGYTTIGATGGNYDSGRPYPWIYNSDEVDGEINLRAILRQNPSGSGGGHFRNRFCTVGPNVEPPTLTTIDEQDFGSGTALGEYLARTTDVFSLVNDGDYIQCQARSLSPGNQPHVMIDLELTIKGFNTLTAYFDNGHQPPNRSTIPGGTFSSGTRYNNCTNLFDPTWFEDFEEYRFLSSRFQGAMLHLGGTITNARQRLIYNALLDADMSTSAFNSELEPDIGVGTNQADDITTVDAPIESVNPVNLAGMRKFTNQYRNLWQGDGDDFPGSMRFAYVLAVPNTDVVELGPLFDVGAFNPEGCASTSAGLGDPGVLVITNGSSVPKKFNPNADSTRQIEDAGMPLPFEGETPTTQTDDYVRSPEGGLDPGVYKYRYTFRNCCTGKESDPSAEDIEVDTTGNSPGAIVTISFAGVRIPADPQICEICLYRTLEGGDFPIMAKVGCFNVDEASVFVDEVSDAELDFTNEGLSLLNGPMPCVSVVVDYRNRLFGFGDIPNLAPAGTVSVVEGSDIVLGDADVQWDRCLEGKYIKVGSDCRLYEVSRVLPPDEGTSPPIARLKLTEEYEGTTDTGLSYVICGRPNRLYFSEPLEPECWPAAGFLDIEPGDGDRLMGGASNYDSLVICKRRKSYVLRFNENPGTEVIVPTRVSSDIGCIGPRTFAQVEVGTVWLADRGLALFDGRSVTHIPESEAMNNIFVDTDNPNYVRRDRNGRVIDAVGVFYPSREQYLLLLPTVKTTRGCSMMLVWDVKLRNVTLLEFCQEFQSMVVAKDADGNERVYMGDVNGFVWIYDIGDTDGAGYPNATGTVTGDITFAGVDAATGASVLDSAGASFVTGGVPGVADLSGLAGLSGALDGGNVGLAGACVFFRRKGAGYEEPWQSRTIYAATSTRLFVTPQWGPDVPYDPTGTDEYEFMIGAIELDLFFKPQNYGIDDMQKRDWRQIVVHEREQFASQLRIDLLRDFASTDIDAGTVVDPVTGEVGEGRVFRMDYEFGRQVKPVGRQIYNHMAIRMRNFAPEAPIRVINHSLCVTPRSSK